MARFNDTPPSSGFSPGGNSNGQPVSAKRLRIPRFDQPNSTRLTFKVIQNGYHDTGAPQTQQARVFDHGQLQRHERFGPLLGLLLEPVPHLVGMWLHGWRLSIMPGMGRPPSMSGVPDCYGRLVRSSRRQTCPLLHLAAVMEAFRADHKPDSGTDCIQQLQHGRHALSTLARLCLAPWPSQAVGTAGVALAVKTVGD